MRYQVPQFIEVEDKIFGPLTLKQFIYLAGGAGLSFILWRLLPSFLALILIAPVVLLSIALAFYRVHNRPLLVIIEYALKYFFHNKLYLWEPEKKKVDGNAKQERGVEDSQVYVPKLSENRLKDLSWSLDIKENINPTTPPQNK